MTTLYTSKINISSPENFPSTFKCHIILRNSTLEIILIKSENMFTFYMCTISPGDFSVTKREQGIKVDFDKFTRTLIQFFHQINDGSITAVVSEITNTTFKFSFIENNSFRNVTRLELIFYKPDDNEFKRYLKDVIDRFESDNVKLIKENTAMKDRLFNYERDSKNVKSDYNTLKNDYDKIYKTNCLLEDENEKLKNELAKSNKELLHFEKMKNEIEYEREKYKINENKNIKNKELIGELENKIAELNDELKNKERMLRNIKDDVNKIDDLKDDLKSVKKDRDEKLKKSKQLEEKVKDLKIMNEKLNYKIEDLSKENTLLIKKLENAQSVYNHFYKRKNDSQDVSEESSLFNSINPESPPR